VGEIGVRAGASYWLKAIRLGGSSYIGKEEDLNTGEDGSARCKEGYAHRKKSKKEERLEISKSKED